MRLRLYALVSVLLISCLSPVLGHARVILPALIADHMVIQRDQPVHLWGNADPGEVVSAVFQGASATTTADDHGRWSLYLPAAKVGGPYDVEIKGTNTIQIKDVLVGDIWIASGQSNMGFNVARVSNFQAELAAADQPTIRLFHVEQGASDYPLDNAKGTPWTACTPDSVKDFSAVAYFFARKIQDDQKVPIGLVEAAFGGPADAWTSLKALSADASLMPLFQARARLTEQETSDVLRDKLVERLTAEAKAAGKPLPPPAPPRAGLALFGPANLYNGMIAPLTLMPIRGVLWYQGESSSDPMRAPFYARVFQTLIADWRSRWGEGDFPFIYAQLANFKGADPTAWGLVRNAQLETLSVRNTGMAVTNDIGNTDDIHPTNKQDVGARFALAARAIAYGEKIEYSGPLYRSAKSEQGVLRVTFDHAASGLVFHNESTKQFEIAGADEKFVTATVKIEGNSLLLSNPQVAAPQHVRYDWSGGLPGDLFNGEGLPAAVFVF
jgi:sialate O-acetylesterase